MHAFLGYSDRGSTGLSLPLASMLKKSHTMENCPAQYGSIAPREHMLYRILPFPLFSRGSLDVVIIMVIP